jgi:hypothetical protein
MRTYVVVKEYPDGHRLYRLLQATPRELERVRHDWTRIIPIPNIHSGIAILAEASKQRSSGAISRDPAARVIYRLKASSSP